MITTTGGPRAGRRALGLVLVAVLLLVGAGECLATKAAPAWRITFRTGRVMEVASWQVSGGFLTLRLHGGGDVSVPIDTILRTERLEAASAAVAAMGLEPYDLEPGARCDPTADPQVTRWHGLIEETAARHGLEATLVRSVVAAESCGNPDAVSHAGAVGLMQLMPATARDYGVHDAFDPTANVEAGCRHLARLRDKLGGDLDLLLAAYNAGEGTVERHGGVPRWNETVDYVRRVKGWMVRHELADSRAAGG